MEIKKKRNSRITQIIKGEEIKKYLKEYAENYKQACGRLPHSCKIGEHCKTGKRTTNNSSCRDIQDMQRQARKNVECALQRMMVCTTRGAKVCTYYQSATTYLYIGAKTCTLELKLKWLSEQEMISSHTFSQELSSSSQCKINF